MLKQLSEKVKKRILDLALWVIKKHLDQQTGLFLYTYDRNKDKLTPLTWKARGITADTSTPHLATNNWDNLAALIDHSGKIVIDVGASLGMTVQRFSQKARRVYAFEPHPDNYQFLRDQIRIRKIDNVQTYPCAVTDFNGQSQFFGRESHGIHSLGTHNKGKVLSTFEVDAITLDTFWEKEINEPIGLLKIDVEGFEPDVLRGAEKLLADKTIEAVLFEFSPRIHKLRKIDTFEPVTLLQKQGYQVFTMDGKPFICDENNLPKVCDLIAFPEKNTPS